MASDDPSDEEAEPNPESDEATADADRPAGAEETATDSAGTTDEDPFYSPDESTPEEPTATDEAAAGESGTASAGSSPEAPPVVDESTVPNIEETHCPSCGSPIASDAAICPECGVEQETESEGKDIEPLFSAILAFFLPGIGHIYHGQSERGIVIFVGWIAWWMLLGGLFLLVTLLTLGIGAVLIVFLPVVDLLYHVIAAADAYVQGEKIASGQKDV